MPWTTQGGGGGWQGGQGPWGRTPRGPAGTPPDLEELVRRVQERLRRGFPGGWKSGRGFAFLVLVALAIWLLSGFYRVQPDELGVELRFGKYTVTTQPGLNYHLPGPIESVFRPKVQKVNQVEIGYRLSGELQGAGPTRSVPDESLMLTGDENIVNVEFVVQWRIKDPEDFLFNIRNPEDTVKAVAESAMREVIGKTEIAWALAEGRAQIEQQTLELAQAVLDSYVAGILINQVKMQKVDPPDAVIEAFRDVQRAKADEQRLINEAEAYKRDILPRARGEAERILQEAEGYRQQVVAQAEGDAQRFLSVYAEYKQAQDITRKRIYLETMEKILTGMPKVILDEAAQSAGGVVPYLPLPELQRAKEPVASGGAGQ